MNILFPGRHHLLSDFQFKYLYRLIQAGLHDEPDVNGAPLEMEAAVHQVIFAVTSANHSNTRRNPVPFHLRAMALAEFARGLNAPTFVYGIDDVGHLDNFADYTLKKIRHESNGTLDLHPGNTLVACSSPVMEMYEAAGFRVLPVELQDRSTGSLATFSPWELVEMVAAKPKTWHQDREIVTHMHPASYRVWVQYGLGEQVGRLFSDDMIGADGDLTETRDYNSYVREMDDIAALKFRETAPYLRPGRIGDIGCATGSWIQLACREPRLQESDFFGIEVALHLYRICLQRKENGEFPSPYVFFAQKNAVTELCFAANSMNTIHTSSLTHEIASYGDQADLLQFISNRYAELAPGGVWVNRDVVGPADGDRPCLLRLNADDGRNTDWSAEIEERAALARYLDGLSTAALFQRFARDFRAAEGEVFDFSWVEKGGVQYAALSLRNAMEFISKKDYHSNWRSEMHERFCFWSYADWVEALETAGFRIDPNSHAYTNNWLVANRYRGKADLYVEEAGELVAYAYPDTHVLIFAEKRL